MKFSFLICTRNSERVLSEVLNSIINQTDEERNFEVIVVDYKSTDRTMEIARKILFEANVQLIEISCALSGKSPALILGLNAAKGDFIVVVDDDNILFPNYINEAKELAKNNQIGCIGAMGIIDQNLKLPIWFKQYEGIYAIGLPSSLKPVDSVWGAAALINKKAWQDLTSSGYALELNPARESHSAPIAIGGEDGELSCAIRMLGYEVFYSEKLKFVHKFEQKRLSIDYMLKNSFGSSRAVPLIDIYRVKIHYERFLLPFLLWNFICFKRLVGCAIRAVMYRVKGDSMSSIFHITRARAFLMGYIETILHFNRIYGNLGRIKKLAVKQN